MLGNLYRYLTANTAAIVDQNPLLFSDPACTPEIEKLQSPPRRDLVPELVRFFAAFAKHNLPTLQWIKRSSKVISGRS